MDYIAYFRLNDMTYMTDVHATSHNVVTTTHSHSFPRRHSRDPNTIHCRLISVVTGLGRNRPYMSVGPNTRLEAAAIAGTSHYPVIYSQWFIFAISFVQTSQGGAPVCQFRVQFQVDSVELKARAWQDFGLALRGFAWLSSTLSSPFLLM